ncbi:hypothetical protein AAC387_Pa04g0799 [Persea americana]
MGRSESQSRRGCRWLQIQRVDVEVDVVVVDVEALFSGVELDGDELVECVTVEGGVGEAEELAFTANRGVVVWGDEEGEALVGGGVVIGAKDVEEEEGLEGGEGCGVGFEAELPELEGAVDHGTAGVVEEVEGVIEGVLGESERLATDGGVLIDDDGSLVAIVDGSK